MKKIITIIAAVALLAACKKAENVTYRNADNIYFDLEPHGYKDSILYSFALHPGIEQDTVWVPLKIAGNRVDRQRVYAVKVIDTASTALVNLHYEPLKESYTFSSDSGTAFMPVILYNTDTMLVDRTFTLSFQLTPTSDFKTDMAPVTARLVFSNRLEKPIWWNMWLGGYYSQVKHMLFRLAGTTEELTIKGEDAPRNTYYVDKLKILLDQPKTWLELNPDKGYKLTPRNDSISDFYHVNTPDKIIIYKKETSTGKSFFIDEFGGLVI
ncbi:DUF4843 domain-containing protein [Longitalea luteola]|uniref:DUF4843 domain-containing protein n=1 Tax=Longitalea luteola TaxID=2812563 RepID=UPI001A96B4A6|nr:DUF4843 domain-containing protein [Longitalea luteola]